MASSAQEIEQKARPGLIDRKRVDFQLYFKHRKNSWNKCMCRKALPEVLYMYLAPQIMLNLRKAFDLAVYFSAKECFVPLTLNNQNPIIPDLWVMCVSIDVYRIICIMMKCK